MKHFARRSCRPLLGSIAALLLGSAAPLFAAPAPASATWLQAPGTGDWNTGTNWTGNAVPTGTATFATSNTTSVTLSSNASVNTIVFNSGANSFTITATPNTTLTFAGTGISNNSSVTQNFATQANAAGVGYIYFTNSASAGTTGTTAFTNAGGVSNTFFGGAEYFENTSSAGNATFTNLPGTVNGANGGFVYFDNSSSASGATIVNQGASVYGANGGTASFNANSTAGNAVITNNPGTALGAFSGYTLFGNSSTAGNATITNNGATFGGGGYEGAYTWFQNTSSAGSATLIANGGSNGGQGGEIAFYNQSTGGTAKIILNGNGFLDISPFNGTSKSVTIGSLASTGSGSNGIVYLGANNLTVGSNNTTTVFSGVILDNGGTTSGTGGSLTKIGTGALDLTGASTYTGNTLVSGGALYVDGQILSPTTTVNQGGVLGGGGIIGGSLVNNGSVQPGSFSGNTNTLTVRGNYTQGSAGTLAISVFGPNPGQYGALKIGGSAALGGGLNILDPSGFKFTAPGQTLTFLTAGGGVTGTFANVKGLASLDGLLTGATVIYEPNEVVIESTPDGLLTGIHGLTANDLQTARLLDSALTGRFANSPLSHELYQANLGQLISDIEKIDPGSLAVLSNIGAALDNTTFLTVAQRLDAIITPGSPQAGGPAGPDAKGGKEVMPPPANRWGSFVTGSGDFERVDDTATSRGFNMGSGGFTLGVDYRFTDHFVAGIFGGYTNTEIDISNGRVNVNAGKWGLYGTYFAGGFYVNSALEGGYSSYDNHRDGLGGTARSDTDGGDFGALFAPGYNWTMGGLTFGPTTRFQYSYQGTGAFTESGSLAPMNVASQHTESIVSAIGMKASYDWKFGTTIIRPELRLEWEHEYGDTITGIDAQLANGAGNAFRFNSPGVGRDDFHIGAGVAVVFTDRYTAYAYYDGQLFRTNYDASTVTGGLRVSF